MYNTVDSLALKYLFQVSNPRQIRAFLCDYISNSKSSLEIEKLCDFITEAEINETLLQTIVNVIEREYLKSSLKFMPKYLYRLYKKLDNKHMQAYYYKETFLQNELNDDDINSFEKIDGENIKCLVSQEKISPYDKEVQYRYNGNKTYGIYSHSNEIGLNMTLLSTPYGAIIFDCGAKIENGRTVTISEDAFKQFLNAFELAVDDVIAVVISHAHLDHYGSIKSLIKAGIKKANIYIEDINRELIKCASREDFSIVDFCSIETFYDAKIQIEVFPNGHILGSNGYIVHFDNQNIIYTGDYCLHDQLTVKGLDMESLLNNPLIQEFGVSCLITETTYGKTSEENEILSFEQSSRVLKHFIKILQETGYKVFIPSFATGRSQEIAYLLNSDNKILIDGLAIPMTQLYNKYIDGNKLVNSNTHFASTETDTKLRNFDLHNVIVSSSGMITENSTSYNYIKEFLHSESKVCIIKTGFISSESVGNKLLSEWRSKDNMLIDLSLSAHATKNEIVTLINSLNPENVVLIHGDGLDVEYAETIQNVKVILPASDIDETVNRNCFVTDEKLFEMLGSIISFGERLLKNEQEFTNSEMYLRQYKNFVKHLKFKKEYSFIAESLKDYKDNYSKSFEYLKTVYDESVLKIS